MKDVSKASEAVSKIESTWLIAPLPESPTISASQKNWPPEKVTGRRFTPSEELPVIFRV
jgi:hypothetical protein